MEANLTIPTVQMLVTEFEVPRCSQPIFTTLLVRLEIQPVAARRPVDNYLHRSNIGLDFPLERPLALRAKRQLCPRHRRQELGRGEPRSGERDRRRFAICERKLFAFCLSQEFHHVGKQSRVPVVHGIHSDGYNNSLVFIEGKEAK